MKCADIQFLLRNSPDVLTAGEVASLIRSSESYVCRLIRDDRLPGFRVGFHYRVLKLDVIRCLEALSTGVPPLPSEQIRPPPGRLF